VVRFDIEEFNQLPISISYQFTKGQSQDQKVVTKELFKVGSSFPASKTITFENKLGACSMLVHYSSTVNNQ